MHHHHHTPSLRNDCHMIVSNGDNYGQFLRVQRGICNIFIWTITSLKPCVAVTQWSNSNISFRLQVGFRDSRWVDIQPSGVQITMIFKGTLSWGAVMEKHSIIMLRSQWFMNLPMKFISQISNCDHTLSILFYAAGIIFDCFYASYSDVEGLYCTCHLNFDHTIIVEATAIPSDVMLVRSLLWERMFWMAAI